MKERIAYGITGFIGSGKSFVSARLAEQGCAIYSADEAAQRLVLSSALRPKLSQILGKEAYLPNGEYNRPYVAQRLFTFPSLRANVEAVVHPAVFDDFRVWTREVTTPYPFVFMESALLPRLCWRDFLCGLVLVTASPAVRLSRIVARDHTTREAALQRIASQPDLMQYYMAANFLIENEGSEDLRRQIALLLEILKHQNA